MEAIIERVGGVDVGQATAESSSAGATLRCVFRQNYETSQKGEGEGGGPAGYRHQLHEVTNQNMAEAEKSVTRQVERARAYAARKGWTVGRGACLHRKRDLRCRSS